ncbi:MAG: hypothetical protein IJ971_11565 [Bacteroidales bacterium]|nr:hypothetical protein [Bacteroidales bacterium]
MKRLGFLTLAVMALVSASCKKESPVVQEEVVASFTVSMPEEIMTKGYSDGTKATELHYAVYLNGNHQSGTINPQTMVNGSANVNISVVMGYTYQIVFWAQAPGQTYYTFDQPGKTITVNNYTTDANDDKRDAFYRVIDYTYTPGSQTVELYRPFAQINFLASDYTAVGRTVTSKIEVGNLPNVLNVLTGEATGGIKADFKPTVVPSYLGETLQGLNYNYVSMNYVLAPKEKDTIAGNVVGVFDYGVAPLTIPVPNVPYQRNYRTNIYVDGLFTGNASFNVVIDHKYGVNDDQHYDHVPPYNPHI